MVKMNFWMVALVLTADLLVASCTADVGVADNPSGGEEPAGVWENIVEPSEFALYWDLSTYAGDDFYQFAVGGWLEANPLKKGEDSNGPIAEQAKIRTEFQKSLADRTEGDEVLARLKAAFDNAQAGADKEALQKKLADIDAAQTKEEMYDRMAVLMAEGYYMPYMLTAHTRERRVKIYLRLYDEGSEFALKEAQLEQYMSKEEAKKTFDVAQSWKSKLLEARFISEKHDLQDILHRERKARAIGVAGTRADEEEPLRRMMVKIGLGDVIPRIMETGWDTMNVWLTEMDLTDLKCLCKYLVLNRDIPLIAGGDRSLKDLLTSLAKAPTSPLLVRLSGIYNASVPEANRRAAAEMAETLRQVFKDRVGHRTWMSEETKARAVKKADAMQIYLGWPDDDSKRHEWMAGLNDGGTSRSFYELACDLYKQGVDILRSKEGSTDKRDLFYARETRVPSYLDNAFFSYDNNTVFILSSNLVPPIFNPAWSDAANLAVLGASTVGHEIAHGFDSTGKIYDETGANVNWMLPQDEEAFNQLALAMVKRFSNLTYGTYLCDGQQTLNENIADLGGLYIAYEALMNQLDKDGVTGAERDYQGREFFRAFAYGWMANFSDETFREFNDDEHSIHAIRVNGNVYLMDEFYRLFGITGGKGFVRPENRIEIW